jgi:hypothetical protein
VPLTGWTCLEVEDLGGREEICEWCGTQSMRHVHIMSNAVWPHLVRVGHDCAEEMGDPSEPAREGVFDSGPQLRSPSMQPPSSREGVWVHAFWFVLIFAAFLTYCQRSGQ